MTFERLPEHCTFQGGYIRYYRVKGNEFGYNIYREKLSSKTPIWVAGGLVTPTHDPVELSKPFLAPDYDMQTHRSSIQ